MNRGRVDVGDRGNGTDAAVPHIGEKERFAADEYIEASLGIHIVTATRAERIRRSSRRIAAAMSYRRSDSHKGGEERLGVVPIARAIFHPAACIRVSLTSAHV